MLPENRSTTIQSFRDFFPSHVAAFASDRTFDFHLPADPPFLNQIQTEFLSRQLGFELPEISNIRQVHGSRVLIAGQDPMRGKNHSLPEADGLMTDVIGLPLAIRTADCLSVFLYDAGHDAIGLLHAGWRGAQKRIITEALNLMKARWGTDPGRVKAALGPAIRPCCYEVGEELTQYFPGETVSLQDRYYLDLPLAGQKELLAGGVRNENIFDCGICTSCDKEYFSYRRDGEKAGRMIALMMLKTDPGRKRRRTLP